MILCRSLKCGHTFDAAVAVKARRKSLTSQWVRRRRRAKWNGVRVSCGHYDVSMFCSQDMEYRLFGRSSVPKERKEHLVPAKCSRGCWNMLKPILEMGRACTLSCCSASCLAVFLQLESCLLFSAVVYCTWGSFVRQETQPKEDTRAIDSEASASSSLEWFPNRTRIRKETHMMVPVDLSYLSNAKESFTYHQPTRGPAGKWPSSESNRGGGEWRGAVLALHPANLWGFEHQRLAVFLSLVGLSVSG